MQLNYFLKKRDILFGRMSLIVRNRVMLTFSIMVVGFVAFSLIPGEVFHRSSLAGRIVMIVFSIGFASIFYLGVQLVLHLIMVLSGRHVGVFGAHALEIKDEGLEESTPVNKSLHRWNPSFSVKEFGNYVWIYPTDGQFFMIPKRPGGHDGNLAEFVAQLKIKIGR